MTTWALLAPGPSASAELAQRVRHLPIGAVGSAFELAPDCRFIASTDAAWWRRYPEAMQRDCKRYAMHPMEGVEQVRILPLGTVNSGVLALECAVRLGATRILLLGFDMHGSHFFGDYTNGLRNTQPHQRRQHMKQYDDWARLNRKVAVLNCTPGSALQTFPTARLEDEDCRFQNHQVL